MKRIVSILAIAVVLSLAGSALADLIALWELNGNAMDSVAANHGSEYGDPCYVSGVFGQAIELDGQGDYVDCGNDPVFGVTAQISVGAWARINAVDRSWQTIIAKGDSAWRLSLSQTGMKYHFGVTGGPSWQYVDGTIAVAAGQWRHVCGTYDGINIRLYVDGAEDPGGPVIYTGGVTTNSYNVYIGENSEATGRYWDGAIDDLAVFDHALSAGEIIQLRDEGGASFIPACGGQSIDADINVDCKVNAVDYSLLAQDWFEQGPQLAGDISGDLSVNWLDLRLLTADWLRCINLPPRVYAGSDQRAGLPAGAPDVHVHVDGTVIDDGLPIPPGQVALLWQAITGPNTVTFDDANSEDTMATFYEPGTYALQLTASDGEYPVSDTMTVVVAEIGGDFKARAAELVSSMTLEEKVSQMGSSSPAIPRLGIAGYGWWNEALHGVMSSGCTVFPQAIALAGTWDPNLIHRVSTAISDEARVKNNTAGKGLTYWSPTINIARDPRWGRNEEGYGEDPYLVSRIAVAFVTGMQGHDPIYLKTVSTPKHFIANNTEYNRHSSSSDVDDRNLREYYMPAFKACVAEGGAQSVMGAYNALNGVPCCGNYWLLTEVLRDEWGFDGYVVSDCGAISDIYASHHYVATAEEAAALGVISGTDLNCGSVYQDSLLAALQQGLLTEADIDKAVTRLLTARFRLGEFDPPEFVPYRSIPSSKLDSPEHRALALETARKAIVLLKNTGILPLDINALTSIAVIGPNANRCVFGGYSGTPNIQISPLQGIQNKVAGHGITVSHAPGCEIQGELTVTAIPSAYLLPGNPGLHGLWAEYFNNTTLSGNPVLLRVDSQVNFNWGDGSPDPVINPDEFSVRWTGQLLPPVTRTYQLAVTTDDGVRLYLDGQLLIDEWHDHATTTYYATVNLLAQQQYDLRMEFYENKIHAEARLQWDYMVGGFDDAAEIASNSDVAIVIVGTDLSVASEGRDRSDIDLPGVQEDLIQAVYQANPNTIVVLINNGPVAINWTQDNVPAILDAWYPGQAGGTAIADVLFGDFNPGGKLPQTFYRFVTDLPGFDEYDVINGGRTYLYFEGQVLYPFGHGLSYTEFSYSNLQIEPSEVSLYGEVSVSVDVRNIGSREGDEVVQLYVHDLAAGVKRPIKELKRFRRITLQPAETRTVTFALPISELAFYDVNTHSFIVEPGTFEIMLGSSSADIRLTDTLLVRPRP